MLMPKVLQHHPHFLEQLEESAQHMLGTIGLQRILAAPFESKVAEKAHQHHPVGGAENAVVEGEERTGHQRGPAAGADHAHQRVEADDEVF